MGVFKCAGKDRLHADGQPYCDYESPLRWIGPCPGCGKLYNCVPFGFTAEKAKTTLASVAKATEYHKTGVGEFDRVVGGGLVKGSTVLFGGEKGAGKTSLLLMLADAVARDGRRVLYASGEQNAADVGRYAHRLGIANEHVELMGNACDAYEIVERAEDVRPFLLILDSLQVMTCSDVKGDEGSTVQGIAVTNLVTAHCKRTHQCAIMVNHLSKSGEFAGSETVGHLVDTVLVLGHKLLEPEDESLKEFPRRFRPGGEDHDKLRVLSVEKNRNGESFLESFWEMTPEGLKVVAKKSKLEVVSG